MAQRALVTSFVDISGTLNVNEMEIVFDVCYLEETVEDSRKVRLTVISQWTDTVAQIKNKLQTAIIADGAANGYTQLTTQNILMPTYQKG